MSGANLTYIGSAAAVRDMLAMSDAIEGPGKLVNYFGVRCVGCVGSGLYQLCDDDFELSYGTIIGAYFVNSASLITVRL